METCERIVPFYFKINKSIFLHKNKMNKIILTILIASSISLTSVYAGEDLPICSANPSEDIGICERISLFPKVGALEKTLENCACQKAGYLPCIEPVLGWWNFTHYIDNIDCKYLDRKEGSLTYGQPIKNYFGKLPFSEIKCTNSQHVLTERPNGKLACVYETTAEKLNWSVIYGVYSDERHQIVIDACNNSDGKFNSGENRSELLTWINKTHIYNNNHCTYMIKHEIPPDVYHGPEHVEDRKLEKRLGLDPWLNAWLQRHCGEIPEYDVTLENSTHIYNFELCYWRALHLR